MSKANYLQKFTSMRTGIVLLLLVAGAAVIGTFLPQGREVTQTSPLVWFLYHAVGLGDVYHAWWFQGLLGLLCSNIIACVWQRFPVLWRRTWLGEPWPKIDSHVPQARLGTQAHAIAAVEAVLNEQGCSWQRRQQEEQVAWLAYRHRWAPWGTFLAHISVLLIVLGGLYGNLGGFQKELSLIVGESKLLDHAWGEATGLELELADFRTEYYANGQVSDWISELVVRREGQELARQAIKVNHPLEVAGIHFYQAFYGQMIETRLASGETRLLEEKQIWVLDQERQTAVQAMRYIPDFDPDHPMTSRSQERRNPYVLYVLYEGGRQSAWGAAPIGQAVAFAGGETVSFTTVYPFSGLQIKYDPGLPLVWSGFFCMSLGFFLGLYGKARYFACYAEADGRVRLGGIKAAEAEDFCNSLRQHTGTGNTNKV